MVSSDQANSTAYGSPLVKGGNVYTFTWTASAAACEEPPPVPGVSVTGSSQCVPATGTWTVTWTVKNESTLPETLAPVTGGITPASVADVPAGATAQFTQTGVGALPTSATFRGTLTGGAFAEASGEAPTNGTCTQSKPDISVTVDDNPCRTTANGRSRGP